MRQRRALSSPVACIEKAFNKLEEALVASLAANQNQHFGKAVDTLLDKWELDELRFLGQAPWNKWKQGLMIFGTRHGR